MQVNRASASINHQEPLDGSITAKARDAAPASGSLKVGLKHRITQRSQDYLLRLHSHGTLLQKPIAGVAYCALRDDTFMPNPAREKPVSQFGICTILDEQKGILLANFMPHDDMLELVALGFRAQSYFDSEASGVDNVLLEHARALPEVQTAPSEADGVAARKELKKQQRRYESQSMYRTMTNKLADQRVEDGSSSSRLTALPISHASVVGGLARAQTNSFASKVRTRAATMIDRIRTQAPETLHSMTAKRESSQSPDIKVPTVSSSTNPQPVTPRGQQYQFGKNEFANFYENHWSQTLANTPAYERGDVTAPDFERAGETNLLVLNRRLAHNPSLAPPGPISAPEDAKFSSIAAAAVTYNPEHAQLGERVYRMRHPQFGEMTLTRLPKAPDARQVTFELNLQNPSGQESQYAKTM